jgi:hypothetical protein
VKEVINSLKTVLFCIVVAILYGVLHDLITTQISIEYFTVGHPKIIESTKPIHLALLWGVIATWWVGLILGVIISVFAFFGKRPKTNIKRLFVLILKLVLTMSILAVFGGAIGYITAKLEVFYLVDELAIQIKPEKHHLFLVAGWSHTTSYLGGIIGGIILSIKIWKERGKATINY